MKIFTCLVQLACLVAAPLVQAAVPVGTDYSLINKTADTEAAYRNRTFCAYLPLKHLRDTLRTNNYSFFENPTGIYYSAGEQFSVEVQGKPPHPPVFIIHNFDRDGGHAEFPLKSGKNTFTATTAGLGYFNYRAATPQTAPPLKVKLEGGHVNGVFTHHDDVETWKRILAGAKGNIIDILGERVHLSYNVDALLKNCPDRGPELIALYDEVLRLQQDMLGWEKYNRHPGNHIHGRVQWSGYMHADYLGTAYINTVMNEVGSVDGLKKSVWGIAHEFGHINQCRPGMMWAGTQEVTNNIFSTWCGYHLNPDFCRLEHETTPVMGYHKPMRGGRFDCYINSALVRRQLWQFMTGPDAGVRNVPTARTGDHFVSVAPLWQLQLYFAVARGMDGFYPYIYEQARKDAADTPHGRLRVAFCTRAADAVKLDLSEFFVKTGILAPMNRMVEDYQSHHVTITREMCEAAIAHMRQYPKPDSSVIYYINANNVHIFRDRLPVKVAHDYKLDVSSGIATIPANQWENAVAFECYRGRRLCRVALRGLNHKDNATTDLIVPQGTTSIRAVQWDGQYYTIWKAPK